MRRFLMVSWPVGMLLATTVAAGQATPRAVPRGAVASPYVRTDMIRAGISLSHTDTLEKRPQTARTHRVKHAVIGASVGAAIGLVVGAAAGAQIERTRPGIGIPATVVVGVEGAAIGLVAGLVVGALVP